MPPTWNDGMLEFWNNGQKIDIVPIVPALHHSSIPIPGPYGLIQRLYWATNWTQGAARMAAI